jgi:hypothetical protein
MSEISTLTQLLEYHDEIINALCDESNVDVIYLDFDMVFDKVDHSSYIAIKITKCWYPRKCL